MRRPILEVDALAAMSIPLDEARIIADVLITPNLWIGLTWRSTSKNELCANGKSL